MKTDQAAKRAAKSNRKRQDAQRELTRMLTAADAGTLPERTVALTERTVAIWRKDGTSYLICEIEKDGTPRVIGRGRYIPEPNFIKSLARGAK